MPSPLASAVQSDDWNAEMPDLDVPTARNNGGADDASAQATPSAAVPVKGALSASQPPGDDSRLFRVLGLGLEFMIIASIVFVMVKTLVFNTPIQQQALQQALMAAGIGVTVVCLIAWLMDLLGLAQLNPTAAKLLWSVLIASILGNTAVIYKRQAEGTPHVQIACAVPLAAVKPGEATVRRYDTNYKHGDSIAFLLGINGLVADDKGNYVATLRYSFEDPQTGRAAFLEYPLTTNPEANDKDPEHQKRKAAYKAIASECVTSGAIQVAQSMHFGLSAFPSGTFPLNITVVDRNSSTVATTSLKVQLVD